MGCDCDCHKKLNKIGVLGCCFKCEAEHDPLRNALLQVDDMKAAIRALMDDRAAHANHPNPEIRLGLSMDVLLRLESFVVEKPLCECGHSERMHRTPGSECVEPLSKDEYCKCGCYAQKPVGEVCGRILPTNVRCDESIPCPHHGRVFAEKRICLCGGSGAVGAMCPYCAGIRQ